VELKMNENTPTGEAVPDELTGTGEIGSRAAAGVPAAASTRQLHVVVGAGPIGSGIAQLLTASGHLVRIVTRSGSGPAGTSAELVAADASDTLAMAKLTEAAAAVYNCANPPYHRWPELWPPIAASLLGAAERCGGVLVTIGNLYGYGPARLSQGTAGYDQVHPMTEGTPLAATGRKGKVRAQMWRDALAAHEAGRVQGRGAADVLRSYGWHDLAAGSHTVKRQNA
jgi:hypothetical protein